MKQGSTIFLRLVIGAMGLLVATLCFFVLPAIHAEWGRQYPDVAYLRYPAIAGLVMTAVAFYGASYHTFKLLNLIDTNKAFSDVSVQALMKIKYCGIVIGTIYAAGMPLIYYAAEKDDAPGLILIGLVIGGAAFVVATFAAVLQKLLASAIAIKKENDLTV